MNTETLPIRILVVDDHPVVLDGLIAMLSTQNDFEVVGKAANGANAIHMYNALLPDVLLLDLEMPDMDGVSVLKELIARDPSTRVIVFTAFDTDERILSAIQAGAQGYLLKGTPRAELFNAIRVVNRGESLLEPVVTSRLLGHIQRTAEGETPGEALTDREMEVLNLLAQGKTNKEIAKALVITERTVKFHVSSILRNLQATNRTEAVSQAARLGLIEL